MYSNVIKSIGLLVFFSLLIDKISAQQIAPFKEGDRVVFLGNSITDGGHYHSYIWLYYMTRFPEMRLTFLNAGIGGDRVGEMLRRLDGDVFSKRPTVLLTTFGMNDSGYFEYNESNPDSVENAKVKESLEGFQQMEKRFKDLSDTRLVLMGSTPYDDKVIIEKNTPFRNKHHAMLRIVDFQKEAAKRNNWEFIDFNQPLTELNQKIQKKDPTATLSGNDRIHPENDGHMVMAYLLLKSQGFANKEVAKMKLDVSKSKLRVVSSSNCNISNLKSSTLAYQFDYLANALPYPLDTVARGWNAKYNQADALKVIPFQEEMNRELLVVDGLEGIYKLVIDQEVIGDFDSSDLSKGINLASYTQTPQYQQALKVMFLNEERWELERRFRELAWVQYNFFQPLGLLNADDRRAIEILDKHVPTNGWLKAKRDLYSKAMHPEIRNSWYTRINLIIDTIYEVNKPIKRTIKLVKVSK